MEWVDWGEDAGRDVLDDDAFEGLSRPRSPVVEVALRVGERLVVEVFSVDDCVDVAIVVEDTNDSDTFVVLGEACDVVASTGEACDVVASTSEDVVAFIAECVDAMDIEDDVILEEEEVFAIEREAVSSG